MLNDEVRTGAYAHAIAAQPSIRNGGVVLDVGAGTGILSIMCALAGARKVYAVEASDMAFKMKEIVKANGVEDIVTIIHSRLEDVELPEKVDVVVSEWMGMALLFESMWEPVLLARDRWLKPEGSMLPSKVEIFAAPLEVKEYWQEKVKMWDDVWGLNMSPLVDKAKEAFLVQPLFDLVLKPKQLIGDGEKVITIDMMNVQPDDMSRFSHTWTVRVRRDSNIHGIATWFVCIFEKPSEEDDTTSTTLELTENSKRFQQLERAIAALEKSLQSRILDEDSSSDHTYSRYDEEGNDGDNGPVGTWLSSWWLPSASKKVECPPNGIVALDTSPLSPHTHWGQTVLLFDDEHSLEAGDEVGLKFVMERNMEHQRHYRMTIEASPTELPDPWYELKWFCLWK